MRANQLFATTTGTSITINDSAEDELENIKLIGHSKQKHTDGRNFLPIIPKQSQTQSGVTLTSNGDGSFTAIGTATETKDIIFLLANPVLLPNQPIYVHIRNNVISNASLVFYGSGRTSAPSFSSVNRIMTSANLTNMALENFGIHVVANSTVNITFTPSLELTDEVTEYEEYTGGQASPSPEFPQDIKSCGENGAINETIENLDRTKQQILSFPMAQGQKLYEEEELKENGKDDMWEELVLDGETTGRRFTAVSDYLGLHYFTINGLTPVGINGANDVMSTHFIAREYTSNCIYITGNGKTIVFVMSDQTIDTVQKANEWLSEQYTNGTPVKVLYKKANPTTTPYTPEQELAWEQIKKARTYKNVTYISSEDVVPATVQMTYVRDLQTVIDNLSN